LIDPTWKRICGLQIEDSGDISAVWLAHDANTDTVHIYDACSFKDEVPVVIAEGLNARGRHIPISWSKKHKAIKEQLEERGCRFIPEPLDDSEAYTKKLVDEVEERFKTRRLRVDKRLKNWHDEYKTLFERESKTPVSGYPLMAATRHAIGNLKRARGKFRKKVRKYPQVAMI